MLLWYRSPVLRKLAIDSTDLPTLTESWLADEAVESWQITLMQDFFDCQPHGKEEWLGRCRGFGDLRAVVCPNELGVLDDLKDVLAPLDEVLNAWTTSPQLHVALRLLKSVRREALGDFPAKLQEKNVGSPVQLLQLVLKEIFQGRERLEVV